MTIYEKNDAMILEEDLNLEMPNKTDLYEQIDKYQKTLEENI